MNAIQKFVARAFNLELKAKSSEQRLELIPSYSSGRPQNRSDWNTKKAIEEGLKASAWVYSCVKRKADAAASVPLIVEQKRGDVWERVANHPLEQLLREPNQHLTGKKLVELLVYHLELGGEAYWHIVTARNTPIELWSLMPDSVKPIPSIMNFLDGFEYTIGSKKQILEPQYVAQFLYTDPSSFYRGLSPLKAVAQAVDTDIDAVKFNRVAMQNRSITDGVFSTNETLSDDQWKLMRQQIKEQHTTPDNARTPWVLGAGMTWQQMTNTLEMDFLQSRPFTRDEIYTAFRVPVILDNPTGATFANLDTAKRIFWQDSMLPLLTDICSSITFALVPWFGSDASMLRVVPDVSNVEELEQTYHARAVTASVLIKAGFDAQEVAERLNLGLSGKTITAPAKAASRGVQAFTRQVKALDWTDERKAQHWKARDDPRQKLEAIAVKGIRAQFESELEQLEKANSPADFEPNQKQWTALLEGIYLEVAPFFAEMEGTGLLENQKTFSFLNTDKLRAWVKKNAAEQLKNILSTTKDRIKTAVQTALESGQGTDGVIANLRSMYSNWTQAGINNSRAWSIARTEVGRAGNYGALEGAKSAAASVQSELEKTWVSSRDERVREEHSAIDGESIGVDDEFSNGRQFPDEPNCRCVLAYQLRR